MCPAPDHALAELARRQWGVVARRQLAAVGVSRQAVERRIARRQLVRLHRGVYAVGHARLTPSGFRLAAVLAVPPPAALSHRSAAALHGLRQSSRTRIDVTTTSRRAEDRPGIEVHRTAVLTAADVTVAGGVPVTTVARTLVDLAGVLPQPQLARALDEAELLRSFDLHAIEAAMGRTRGRGGRGHAALVAELERLARLGAQPTRSPLEERFEAFLRAHELPPAQLNVHLDGREVDAWWARQQVAVEVDGWAAHRSRAAFQRDRAKGNALTLDGIVLLRFTDADLRDSPQRVAAELRRALGA